MIILRKNKLKKERGNHDDYIKPQMKKRELIIKMY